MSHRGTAYEDYRAEMRWWYNGFRFSPDDETTVYNPISVALTVGAMAAEGMKLGNLQEKRRITANASKIPSPR